MTRRSQSRRRQSKGLNRRQMIIATLGVGALYGGLMLGTALMPSDDASYTKHLGTHFVVFLDNSEGYSFGQEAMIDQAILQELPDRIRSGDRLDFFHFVEADGVQLVQSFSDTSPKRASEVNRALHSAKRQSQLWESQFWSKFCAHFKSAREVEPLDQSPLIEAWFEIARILRQSKAEHKELIIISDMLQYSGSQSNAYNGSLYRLSESLQRRYPTNFGGADIRLLYMFRPDRANVQNDRHREWLAEWFGAAKAGNVVFE